MFSSMSRTSVIAMQVVLVPDLQHVVCAYMHGIIITSKAHEPNSIMIL